MSSPDPTKKPDAKSLLKRALGSIPDPKAAAPAARPADAPAGKTGGSGSGGGGGEDMLGKLLEAMKREMPRIGKVERQEPLLPPEPERPPSPTGNAFIDRLIPFAMRAMRETTVPASVLLAQAVVESAWGERLLARDYHNLFAVEGTGPAGSVYLAAGGEAPPAPGNERQYRKYHHDGESIIDHARLLAKSEKYQAVMSVNDRPEIFARALSGRYSPLPHYGDTLVRIMRQFDLQRFDRAT